MWVDTVLFTLPPECPLFLLSLLLTKTMTYGWHVASGCRCLTQRHFLHYSYLWRDAHVYIGQHTCTCICMCGCVHICIHMHACCPDGRGVALGEWWGSSIFVDQSQGQGSCSGPRSRWMEASDGRSLAGCSIPAGPHRPTATNPHHHLSPFSLSIHRDLSWKCPSTGIHFVLCATAHTNTCSHIGVVHK